MCHLFSLEHFVMRISRFVIIPFMFSGGTAIAESPVDLQPRDLDGDSSTIEAYYYPQQNITWLANSNLGKSDSFGLIRGDFSEDASEVNADGNMFNESLPAYLGAVNQSEYLGYSSWRLPVAASDDPGCLRDASAPGSGLTGVEGMVPYGSDCSGAEVGEFNQFLVATYGRTSELPFPELINRSRVWLSSNGPNGRHHFFFLTTDRGDIGDLRSCPTTDGIRDCVPAAVWLVHDGDIGVEPSECIDTDGDGWGWNGTSSCLIETVTPVCIDTPPVNDGWGWNGSTSCRIEIINPVCVDSPPLNDGWGWNGVTSCRI
jgi:hypothetical protein